MAGGLIALALTARWPELAVTVVEGGRRVGGNHVWSFFDADLDAPARALVAPLARWRWPGQGYDVAFPGLARTLPGTYNSIPSEALAEALAAALPAERLLVGTPVAALDRAGATLADGRRIDAGGVIDARGIGALGRLDLGWQKFAGRMLRLDAPHGLTRPTIMDARVPQRDGYRFVYLLPVDPKRVFVEDTYYADAPALDVGAVEAEIAAYAAGRGWRIAAVERTEAAALPIAMGGDIDAYLAGPVAKAGMAAALFHPMTGYSLPDAAATALLVAAQPALDSASLAAVLDAHARDRWRANAYYRLLARMLFRAADPADRWRVLRRFYSLDAGLIARLYSGRSTRFDKTRILCGKPPVPITRALGVLKETGAA